MKINRKDWLKDLRPLVLFSQHQSDAQLYFDVNKIYVEGAQGYAAFYLKTDLPFRRGYIDCTLFIRILSNSKSAFLNLEIYQNSLVISEADTNWTLPYTEVAEPFEIAENGELPVIYEELSWVAQALSPLVQHNGNLPFSNYLFLTHEGVRAFDGYLFGTSEVSSLPEGQVIAVGFDALQTIKNRGVEAQWAVYHHGNFNILESGPYRLFLSNTSVEMPEWDRLREDTESCELFLIGHSFIRLAKAAKILPTQDGHSWVSIAAKNGVLSIEMDNSVLSFQATEEWYGPDFEITVDADWLSLGASYCQYWGILNDKTVLFSSEKDPEKGTLLYYMPHL